MLDNVSYVNLLNELEAKSQSRIAELTIEAGEPQAFRIGLPGG